MLVDFGAWASPTLDLALGGRTYTVRPPSVGRARQILACVVRSEISLGLVDGPMPAELQTVLDEIRETPLGVVSLGQDVYDQMVADEIPAQDVDRVSWYAVQFWGRGKKQADALADLMWATPPDPDGDAGAPKAPRARSRSGRSTASANRTRTASTRTTKSPST